MDRQELTRNNLSAHPGSLLLLARPRFPALAHGFWGRLPQSQNPSFLSFSASCGNVTKSAPSPQAVGSEPSFFPSTPTMGFMGQSGRNKTKSENSQGLGDFPPVFIPTYKEKYVCDQLY